MNRNMILVLSLATGLWGCSSSPATAPAEAAADTSAAALVRLTPAQMQVGKVQTGSLSHRAMPITLRLNGQVEAPPQNLISVSFPLGGYIQQIAVLPGQHVRKGEPIAVVDDPSFIELQQDYLTTRAQAEALRLEYERQAKLNASKASSDKALEQAKAAHESAQVTLAALAQKLSYLQIDASQLTSAGITSRVTLRSPITGYVAEVHVNVGKYISPTDVLVDLVDPSDLHLALTVFGQDLPAIQVGQQVTAWSVHQPSQRLQAEVMLPGKLLDGNSSTQVHCHFKGAHEGLLPGMFMAAELVTAALPVPCLPEDAVVRMGSQELVFVEEGKGAFKAVPVTTGVSVEGYVQLQQGAEALQGKTLAVSNAYTLLMAMQNAGEEE